ILPLPLLMAKRARSPEDDEWLHDSIFVSRTDADAQVLAETYDRTGAILMGRRMFEVGVNHGEILLPSMTCRCSFSPTNREPRCPCAAARCTPSSRPGSKPAFSRPSGGGRKDVGIRGRKHRPAVPGGGPSRRTADPSHFCPARQGRSPIRRPRL